ncbi:family 43 glycosylhydrolase [Breznakiella homolactica]|uniref:Family 43 glycosylhydrolase n=1 Tax=Breznakiella homolactica TaxID=2798577 RepID=A0A7T7XPI0_9SPIR|nr:family 43 glycosylhydrolase [Breznakiella homolactica]QQO10110.1 family 43 glycosylhydrolase [Breznakiella homolactica]
MKHEELRRVKQVWTGTEGLPADNNHDPSNILYVGGKYYLWITQHEHGKPYCPFKNCKIMYTTSPDGYRWEPLRDALLPSAKGWDSAGVLTANVLFYNNTYYMFYTGVDAGYDVSHTDRYVGIARADSPGGPWTRAGDTPVLGPSRTGFDADSADDVTVIPRDGKFWMYYKGMYPGLDGNYSEVGIAMADSITGPYTRYGHNPVMVGHAFAVWPYKDGYLYLSGRKDTNEGTVYNSSPDWHDPRGTQSLFWSGDGIHFEACCPFENRAPGIFVGSESDITKCWGVSVKTRNRDQGRYIERFDFILE